MRIAKIWPEPARRALSAAAGISGVTVSGNRLRLPEDSRLWDVLRAVQRMFAVAADSPGRGFSFGYVGFLGYDTVWLVEWHMARNACTRRAFRARRCRLPNLSVSGEPDGDPKVYETHGALDGRSVLTGGLTLPRELQADATEPTLTERLDLGVRSGLLNGLHAVLALRRGEPILERYFTGADENWGRPLGDVAFGPTTLHDLRSVTKSVTSLLYGIALDRGEVPPPGARLLDSFPQYPDLAADPRRARWTIAHALNMTLGTAWDETLPYSDPNNSEIAMERAEDRYRFILDRPIVSEPGRQWNYNGGCSALVGYLIERGAGTTLAAYARRLLFDPLSITRFEWNGGRDGVLSAASGLRLTTPDLARIGLMMLAGGTWKGARVVPGAWLEACRTPQVAAHFDLQYSHQWYLSEQPVPTMKDMQRMISAIGNGGQRLYVLPSLDLVMATFSGRYNRPDQWMNPTLVLQRIVLANLSL